MPSKSTVRADLNHLRKLYKSLSSIDHSRSVGGDVLDDPLFKKQYVAFIHKRDKILEKYREKINTLSPVESLIFTLYYLQGLSQKQVATKTNYCKSSITKKLHSILIKLQ